MPKFIESICFQNSEYPLLTWHQQRVNLTFKKFFPNVTPHNLDFLLPDLMLTGIYKVRVLYDEQTADVEYAAYHQRELKSIMVVENDQISYSHKFEDRSGLQKLFDQRGEADEILIVKKGMITDSFYANTAFWDGTTWYTPSSYLLNGVRRQNLLEKGLIKESRITLKDVFSFEKVCLINAMLDLGVSTINCNEITY